MKTLVVEDDATSRKILERYLNELGSCDVVENGMDAVSAYESALDAGNPYDLICLDIMMPEFDGHAVLKRLREIEKQNGISAADGTKVIMTTALDDSTSILGAFQTGCEAYVVKPIDKDRLVMEIRKLGLIE